MARRLKDGKGMIMKSVVCFGDSNTYGHNPVNGERLPESVRWPCLLQNLLGDGFKVIAQKVLQKAGPPDRFREPFPVYRIMSVSIGIAKANY